jgi:hypothetical protein
LKKYGPDDPVVDQSGAAVNAATVTVYLSGTTTAATIYSDDGVTTMTNPLTTDAYGRYEFYVEDGWYKLVFSGGTPVITTTTYDNVEICDERKKPTYRAHMFQGATEGAKIVAAIAAMSSTGGVVDARGFEGTGTISTDVFSTVTKPGKLLLGECVFSVSATQNVPSNWTVEGTRGGRTLAGTGSGSGTVFKWATGSAASTPVIAVTNGEDVTLRNFTIDCNDVTTSIGWKWVASTKWVIATAYVIGDSVYRTAASPTHHYRCTVAGTSHASTEPTWPTTAGATVTDGTVTWTEAGAFSAASNNSLRVENVNVYGFKDKAVAWGSLGSTGADASQLVLDGFKYEGSAGNTTAIGIDINSASGGFSEIKNGHIRTVNKGLYFRYAGGEVETDNIVFGDPTGGAPTGGASATTPNAIEVYRIDRPVSFRNCYCESSLNTAANDVRYRSFHMSNASGYVYGAILIEGCGLTFPTLIAGPTRVTSICNNWAYGPAEINNASASLVSIGDSVAYNTGSFADWVAATAYAKGDLAVPTTANGHYYRCSVAGDSAAVTEPTWPTTDGGTVVDNEVTWTEVGLWGGANPDQWTINTATSHALTLGPDSPIQRDENNDYLALRRGTTPQFLDIYNTSSGTTHQNYEYLSLGFATNVALIGTKAGGTGTVRRLDLMGNGIIFCPNSVQTGFWQMTNAGHFVPIANNAVSIGSATGPLYVKDVLAAGTVKITDSAQTTAAGGNKFDVTVESLTNALTGSQVGVNSRSNNKVNTMTGAVEGAHLLAANYNDSAGGTLRGTYTGVLLKGADINVARGLEVIVDSDDNEVIGTDFSGAYIVVQTGSGQTYSGWATGVHIRNSGVAGGGGKALKSMLMLSSESDQVGATQIIDATTLKQTPGTGGNVNNVCLMGFKDSAGTVRYLICNSSGVLSTTTTWP